MKENKRWILNIFWILLGSALILCGMLEKLDSYWSGMGGGLLAVGIMRIIQLLRYRKDPEYRENWDTAVSDERNKFLASKAWAWAGYWFVIISGVATIVLQILGRRELSTMAGFSVALLVLLYWLSRLYLGKKY